MDRAALDEALLAAHASGDRPALIDLYLAASEATDDPVAAGFYLTHAYVFALDAGDMRASALRELLVAMGREVG